MDCLTKEQLLLLQNHLPYARYEEFIKMFKEEELLPENYEDQIEYIVKLMEEHHYWGEWFLWGDHRVYKRIPKNRFRDAVNNGYLGWLKDYLGNSYLGSRGIHGFISKKSDVIRFLDEHAGCHKQKFGSGYPEDLDADECYPVSI